MNKKTITKIIYFDKETIQNILQEQHHGNYHKIVESSSSVKNEGEIEVGSKVKLGVPFIDRLDFLFNGKLSTSYMLKREGSTTITSTEISEFDKLKENLHEMSNIQLNDIENSSTSMRVAGGFLRILKGGVDGVDPQEFMKVMNNYDGYDTYAVDEETYVRFNNTAFVSNYKRNDLLTTTMTLFCIPIGVFDKSRFDFLAEVSKMEHLFTKNNHRTISEIYPPQKLNNDSHNVHDVNDCSEEKTSDNVTLYDVVYACVSSKECGDDK